MENIGRYEIIEKIGFGGTAIVYKARDPNISRTLAIKILREERCADREYRSRFLREAKAVGILSHPNIVTIYDVSEADNRPYIAMELLNGNTLDEAMKTQDKIPLDTSLDWGIQLADALSYAHSKGIIHRDIKPSNIILSTDNKIKITDFGIAHLEEADVTQHTKLGEVLGTPQYMSPEQVLGKPADSRSDLFSTGVILYQLLTSQKPFKADTLATLLFQIATENPEPIGNIAPELPASLKQCVDKLLKKKPEKRFQNGRDLKHALERVQNDIQESKNAEQNTPTFSIKFKWSIIMGLIVGLTLSLCGSYFYISQQDSMMAQTYKYGATLSHFIAAENAEAVLSEDWANVELFALDDTVLQNLSYLKIIDHNAIIRGSNDESEIGKKYKALEQVQSEAFFSHAVIKKAFYQNNVILDFAVPIKFQKTEIGFIHLGIPYAPIEQLSTKMLLMLALIALITLASVVIASYILGRQFSRPLLTLSKAMDEIETGHYAYRISTQRNDEFGQIFSRFDTMAVKLQELDEKKSGHEK